MTNEYFCTMPITSHINKGNSCPVVLENQGQKYFVKLRAGMSGQYALASEWIGNRLGLELGIHTQTPFWIELNQPIIADEIHIEVRELIAKSAGLNIGFAYQADAKEVSTQALKELDKTISAQIFLLDLVMLNIDRTPSNLNLMEVGGKVISVDYESSLLLQDVLGSGKLLEDQRILHCLRSNPLYAEIEEEIIDAFIEKLSVCPFENIIAEIPVGILSEAQRKTILERLAMKQQNAWFLKETMYKLRTITTESKAAQKKRINQNQADFKRKFKANLKELQ